MKVTLAVAVVACGLVLAGCGSGGDDSAPAASASAPSSASSASPSPTSTPTVVLTDPGNVAGSAPATTGVAPSGGGAVGDAAACHVLLDPLKIGTVTATGLDAVLLSLSFPNGSGAEAVLAGRPSVAKAQSLASTDALRNPLTALLGYVDAYGTSAQPAAGVIGGTTAAIRSACTAVGVTAASS